MICIKALEFFTNSSARKVIALVQSGSYTLLNLRTLSAYSMSGEVKTINTPPRTTNCSQQRRQRRVAQITKLGRRRRQVSQQQWAQLLSFSRPWIFMVVISHSLSGAAHSLSYVWTHAIVVLSLWCTLSGGSGSGCRGPWIFHGGVRISHTHSLGVVQLRSSERKKKRGAELFKSSRSLFFCRSFTWGTTLKSC